jgi:ADP-ribose pyrophosphatase YjhB (NUDIX family)
MINMECWLMANSLIRCKKTRKIRMRDNAALANQLMYWVREMQAISQNGLTYTKDIYDEERYRQLSELTMQMISSYSDYQGERIGKLFLDEVGYATPKLDVRALIFNDDKDILLVKENQDGLWALPGGWADVNLSPKESIKKEVKEETGLSVNVVKLLALWDKLKHDYPPHWPHTYKCFFLCGEVSGELLPNHEVSEVNYFNVDFLPELSTHRITKEQINKLIHLIATNAPTVCD